MATTPIPIVTFQSSIQPVNPPPQANRASENNQSNQNQVQDLQELPVNQIPTQAPGLFGLAFALENLDQRDQNFLSSTLPKAPQAAAHNGSVQNSKTSDTSSAQNPVPGSTPPHEAKTGLGAGQAPSASGGFPTPSQTVAQSQANATPQQQAGAILNLFA